MKLTWVHEDVDNAQSAIENHYGNVHKRYVVVTPIILSSEGNEYIALADYHTPPKPGTLWKLGVGDYREYYVGIMCEEDGLTKEEKKELRKETISKYINDMIIVDTHELNNA